MGELLLEILSGNFGIFQAFYKLGTAVDIFAVLCLFLEIWL